MDDLIIAIQDGMLSGHERRNVSNNFHTQLVCFGCERFHPAYRNRTVKFNLLVTMIGIIVYGGQTFIEGLHNFSSRACVRSCIINKA